MKTNILVRAMYWLMGYYTVKLGCENSISFINELRNQDIRTAGVEILPDGGFCVKLLRRDYKRAETLLDKNAYGVYSVKGVGLPFVLGKYRYRYGMVAGFVLFCLILRVTTLFIWDVRVVSTTDVPHTEILDNLRDVGCGVGTFIPGTDLDDICFSYMKSYDDVSWISVNLRGTYAEVEVRDIIRGADNDTSPANLVAAYDGVIENIAVYNGCLAVENGQTVREGDLLVSGVIDDKLGRLRLCRANGEIMARVTLTINVNIPYVQTETQPGDITAEKRSIYVFGRGICYSNRGKDDKEECDITRDVSSLVLFDCIELPLSSERVVWRELKTQSLTLSREEARERAEAEMAEKIEQAVSGGDILNRRVTSTEDEYGYTLTSYVECIINIAQTKNIETANSDAGV